MPDLVTSEELVRLIRQSGMVDEQKLSQYLQHPRFACGLPPDSRALAEELVRDGVLTRFQSEQFLIGRWRGFVVGKFKLLEKIGAGGMAQVFLAEHLSTKKRAAIKVLPPSKAEHPTALGRFYREARAAGCLDHPNIIRSHEIDQDACLHYIVMDYVEGVNLLDVVRKHGPLDIGRAVSYTRQAALGLDYAFRNKIIHRDVKPANILIDRWGVARVLDMGLARFINDHTDQLTVKYDNKIVLGTADYVAPEQVADSHSADIRADVYALGGTLYFLLAGHPPFPTGTVAQKLMAHRTKEPAPVRSVRPEVSEGLAAVVARMMAKDPKARYQTPAQVASALEEFLPPVVPLPNPDEFPRLCPAVLGDQETADAARPCGASVETPAAGTASLTAVRAAPMVEEVPPSPFGPSDGSPWKGLGEERPRPGPQFPTGGATQLPLATIPWGLLAAVAAALLGFAALIVGRM